MRQRVATVLGALALMIASQAAGPAVADGTRLQPDFTFKRVGVPRAGSGNRITVQIAPRPPAAPSAPASAGEGAVTQTRAPGPAPSGVEWFWEGVSPALADSGPGRLQLALAELDRAPAGKTIPAPRLQSMQAIASAHGIDILGATVGTRVSPALVLAVISVESAGLADAESHAGAQGLMQLMPPTAARFGVSDSFDATQNISGGVAYLDWLMGEFGDDPVLVLAGYNAGEGAVRNHGGVPPYAETRNYVPRVLAAWRVARGLCQTPPELLSDGCVFVVNAS